MKTLFVTAILAFLNLLGFAQFSGFATYSITYGNCELSDPNASLYFNGESSFFETYSGPNNTFSLVIKDTLTNIENRLNNSIANKSRVYTNLKENKLIASNELFLSDIYFTFEMPKSINWEIHNDTKKIREYLCQKATGHFRGRDYTAWFTREVPVGLGPWKFNGLPGLIFEVIENNMHIHILLQSIDLSFKDEIEELNEGYTISVPEYLSRFKVEVLELTPDHPSRHRPSVKTYIDISNFTELETGF